MARRVWDYMKQKPRAIILALKDVSVSQEGKVIVAGREESGLTLEDEDIY